VSDFNTPLSSIDRSSRQKQISQETSELIDTVDQMDLIVIYRITHPTATEYTFFSAASMELSPK
jgi:hypothetical protein